MAETRAARGSCNYARARTSTRDTRIITHEQGSRIAGLLFCAMFAFLSFGAVVWGW